MASGCIPNICDPGRPAASRLILRLATIHPAQSNIINSIGINSVCRCCASSRDPRSKVSPRCWPMLSVSSRARCRSSVMESAGNSTMASRATHPSASRSEHLSRPRLCARTAAIHSSVTTASQSRLSKYSTVRILKHKSQSPLP